MVNGVPVFVNPESELMTNQVASIPMIPHMELGPGKNSLIIGPDDVVVMQMANGDQIRVHDSIY